MRDNSTNPNRERSAEIVALFSVLVHSWEKNDFREAANSHDELKRLGVKVQMPRRRTSRREEVSA